MAWTREREREYQREWARKRRQCPEVRKKLSQSVREYQKRHPLKYGWCNDRASAAKRGHEWTLSRESYEALCVRDCTYCGVPAAPTHGIDRLDNSKGYTEENAVTSCSDCNYAKRKMTVHEFISWARRLVKHNEE